MKVEQTKTFAPVTITLETEVEARYMAAALTSERSEMSTPCLEFATKINALIIENANVFNRSR